MTEHVQEQISAFIDDELSSEECAFLARRLSSDESARAQLTRYAAIGSVLRGETLVANSSLLLDRVHAALDGAPEPRQRALLARKGQRRWAYSLAGAGVAASVAVAALFGLRVLLEDDNRLDAIRASAGAPAARADEPSYVVPSETEARVFTPPVRLTNYLVQHGNYSSGLQRTSVNSNVVGTVKQEAMTAESPDASSER